MACKGLKAGPGGGEAGVRWRSSSAEQDTATHEEALDKPLKGLY